MIMKTLCVTGHRPEGLPWEKDNKSPKCKQFLETLKSYLIYAIEQGFTHFIAGGALGVDTFFALTVIELKDDYKDATLEIAVPCATQSKGWSNANKNVYDYILAKADKVTVLSQNYHVLCMQNRNEYMVTNSDCVLCCFNGNKKGGTYNTIKLAQKLNKKLLHIDLSETAENGGNQMILFKEKVV